MLAECAAPAVEAITAALDNLYDVLPLLVVPPKRALRYEVLTLAPNLSLRIALVLINFAQNTI
jgi:hypothetical protein